MIQKLIYYVTLLLTLSLLWGCTEPRRSFSEIPVPETPLQSNEIPFTLVRGIADTTVPTKNQSILVWEKKFDRFLVYVGLLDLEHFQIVQMKSFEFLHDAIHQISWSPDRRRFIIVGHISGDSYDIAAVTGIDNTAGVHYLHEYYCCGEWCDWFSEDERYILCNRNVSHGMPPYYWVYDTTNWEVVCKSSFFYGEWCPPLPLADGRWWHMVGSYRETEITESSTPPSKLPTPIADSPVPDAGKELCKDDRFRKCLWRESPSGRFIAFNEYPFLYVLDTEQQQIWKVTEKYGRYYNEYWSPDERYLTWIDGDGQIHFFDTVGYSVHSYGLSDAMIGGVGWFP